MAVSALDPNDYEIVEAGPPALDPSEYEVVPEAPAPEKPGKLASLGRGLLQGATLGFADEIAGGVEALTSDKTYAQARDESRAAFKAAQEANPKMFAAGEIGGGVATALVPGLGLAKGAATVGKAALTGAKLGAAAGLGGSEADLTQGDLRGAAWDAGVGALLGAGAGAAGQKLAGAVKGAPARVERRILDDLGNKATAGQRQALHLNKPNVLKAVKRHGIDPEAAPAQVRDHAQRALDAEMVAGRPTYGQADDVIGKVARDDVVAALEKLQGKYSKKLGGGAQEKALAALIKRTKGRWDETVPSAQLREAATDIGSSGFAGDKLNPSASKKLDRAVAKALTNVLNKHLDDAASKAPGLASKVADLKAANKRVSGLIAIKDAATKRASLEDFSPTGLREFSLRGMAEGAYNATAGKAVRPLDRVLAGLVTRAQAGDARALAALQRTLGGLRQGATATAPSLPGNAAGAAFDLVTPAVADASY